MLLSVEALKARHGDCLLVHWGTAAAPRRMLVDGGPPGVYRTRLRPRLMQLRRRGPVGRSGRLVVDAVVVSHAHPDHIHGVLALFRELRRNRARGSNPRFRVRRLWHNSFAALAGAPVAAAELATVERRASPIAAGAMARSIQLASTARSIGLRANRAFGGGVLEAGDRVRLEGRLSLRVIGPSAELIAELREKWGATRQAGEPFEVAAFLDRAVLNLASTVLLISRGRRRILLTGDARGDHILRGLEDAGVLRGATARLDVLKVPHHGSDRNVTVEFFRRLPADHYIVTGNGRHGNPELETLRMLAEARGAGPYTVHFTHRVGLFGHGRRIRAWRAEQQAAGRPVTVAFPRPGRRSVRVHLGDERI